MRGAVHVARTERDVTVTEYQSAPSKAIAIARMYRLGAEPVQALGPGSKEKRSALEALGRALGVDLADVPTKTSCARRIAEIVKVPWDDECASVGDTITLTGLNRLVDGAVDWLVHNGRIVEGELVRALMTVEPAPGSARPTQRELAMDNLSLDMKHNIAELLVKLSESETAPKGVAFRGRAFTFDEVTFHDGAWRDRLGDVQGWLKFETDLADESAEAFDRSLVLQLGLESGSTDVEALGGRLLERLDRAVELRDKFDAELESETEGAATWESATKQWVSDWEDLEDEEESEEYGTITASADVWSIADFVERAMDDNLELSPAYQRADVWSTATAQQLIESILRGIPLPSVILLKYATDDGTHHEVVDGKQRLTSILRFTGTHPVALEMVKAKSAKWGVADLDRVFREDYPAFRRLWKLHEPESLTAQVERTNYFPFPLRKGVVKPLSGELEPLRGKYYSEIKNSVITVAGDKHKVSYVFERQSQYKVPVIEYKSVKAAQVHEVFSLYNKQGKHLNAEEIRNALYHQLPLMRGLLVTAGDSDNIAEVAPFLVEDWEDLSSTQEVLNGHGYAKAGYKRTKLLSWVLAGLIVDDEAPEVARSTSAHINGLLKATKDNRRSMLWDETVVLDAMLLLDHAIDAHTVIPDEAWAPQFKPQSKWQELQLVGTLIGLAAARAVYEERLPDIVESKLEEIAEASASAPWKRPTKTQSKEQWMHTARVVTSLLELLEADLDEVTAVLQKRFGSSGIRRLAHMADLPYTL